MSDAVSFDLTLFPAPVLRRPAAIVESFDAELEAMVNAMFDLMFESQGVGLAAPQVGLKKRILVLNETGDREKRDQDLVLINPKILSKTGELTRFDEGCLSFPDIYASIERPDRCTIEAQDLQGNVFQGDYDGFLSRIIQHEFDHLEGILLVDRMSPADKLRNKAALDGSGRALQGIEGRRPVASS